MPLSRNLILNRYFLSLFGVRGIKALSDHLSTSVLEGTDANNVSNFHHELVLRMYANAGLTKDQLLEYDQNIVSHTLSINEKRKQPIRWKYFQYLSLLFTEIYLDRYFNDKEALLESLNEYVEKWNDHEQDVREGTDYVAEIFELKELNKLAFWNATGSGKTLLMHVNIKQFLHYQKKYRAPKINKVLLVTPNEGLSEQHLREFKLSNIGAEWFSKKAGGVFSGTEVEVIEISKLAAEHGEKTVAVDAFETNNLVLIDEGHRGVAGDQWKVRRDKLSESGFAFEYSATFGQAVSAANKTRRKELVEEYSKNILFDYSYKYFYGDGYGKDYQILNVPHDDQEEFIRKYLTGALLSFYQQQLIYKENPTEMKIFNLTKPLWVFVGGKVNAVRIVQGKETSDVLQILKFFRSFIQDSQASVNHLEQLINGEDGILDQAGQSIFTNYFNYIRNRNLGAGELYQDILSTVFNTNVAGANLYLDNLKGIDGELGLRVGDATYFGVINVGDDAKLFNLCQGSGIDGISRDFSSSLFQNINESESTINLLIGSKKFTEGWSSWRVSAMGLMNVGRSEGSQVIQLFGRGVRLQGYEFSLKRSRALDQYQKPANLIVPDFIPALETLNIFGIRADYMDQFKQFLEDEGLPTNDSRYTNLQVPVIPTLNLENERLKVLRVREGIDFKKDVTLDLEYQELDEQSKVTIDWYPRIQVLRSLSRRPSLQVNAEQENSLDERHLAFLDWDEIFFEMQRFKNERAWYNLSIKKEVLQDIISRNTWYTLFIPEAELEPSSFRQVFLWQDIVTALLKGYITRYYNLHKSNYLGQHMETIVLGSEHPNFIAEYEVAIEESQTNIINNLNDLVQLLREGNFDQDVRVGQDFTAFEFLQHLYKPLLYLDEGRYRDIIKITPVALNEGEKRFVDDLKRFYQQYDDFFEGKKLFLLRNISRRGVGFFDSHGFFPDFILWLIDGEKQRICFVDPKGLRQITGFEHPKMKFYRTIREEIEPRLNDPEVSLHSVIISNTAFSQVQHWRGQNSIIDFNARNIYFVQEQQAMYIKYILEKILRESEEILLDGE